MEYSDHSQDKEMILVRSLRILAGLCGLVSLLSLTLLWMSDSYAQSNTGFTGGEKKFSNPFADIQKQRSQEQKREKTQPARSAPQRGTVRKNIGASTSQARDGSNTSAEEVRIEGSSKDPNDVPEPVFRGDTVEVGGQNDVVSNKQLTPLSITPEAFGIDANIRVKDFNFPDADIIDVAKTLGKLTGKNFILDKKVSGKVSIISNSTITVGDAWRAFLTALDINQLTLLPSGRYIRIARQRDARDRQLHTYTDGRSPDIDSLITRIFTLKHINADEVARTFRSFVPPNARIIPYAQTNSVIITDTGSNIKKLEGMLKFLDIPGFDAGIEVIAVKHASAAELAKLIDSLIPGAPAPGSTRRGRSRSNSRSRSSFAARKTKGGGIINNIIADERTNTLIVHANVVGAQRVRSLVRKLDKKLPALTGGGKIHVIYLKFSDAEEIAKTLNDLSQSNSNRRSRFPRSRRSGSSTGSNPNATSASLFEGQIRVSADKSTNSLVVTASPADFVTVQRVVNQLDIDRDQVFVEALIMEMNLNKDFQYSINAAKADTGIFLSPQGDLVSQLTNPAAAKGLILRAQDSNTTSLSVGGSTVDVPNWLGIVKAIQTNSQGNILATPHILTLDNVEATFEATQQIPVLSSAATTTTVSQNVTYQPVGLTVKIKPQINKVSNFVKMEIDASLSDITKIDLPDAVEQQAISTFERKTSTTVVVADGDTVILGGLIRDNISETESKIPLLGDIPLLGWLFKGTERSKSKTNLLIFMTPKIIRHYEKARAILDKKLQQRDNFIEKNAGGKDPYREKRDEMIRQLPDIRELLRREADTAFTIGDDEETAPNPPIQLTLTRNKEPLPIRRILLCFRRWTQNLRT